MPSSRFRVTIRPSLAIPSFLRKDVAAKLAYLDQRVVEAEVAEDGQSIVLGLNVEPGDAVAGDIEPKVERLVVSMVDGAFEPRLRVEIDHLDRAVSHNVDPLPDLMARGEVVPEGPGYFILGPMMTRLLSWFEEQILGVADDLGAAPYRFPSLIAPGYLERVKYFENFPHSLGFVTHLREDLEVIEQFSKRAACTDGTLGGQQAALADIQAMLSPTVCHHLYLALADSQLPPEGVVVTAHGNCFRYESFNMVSLERTWNFTMREIIFVGSPDHVARGLEAAQEKILAILDRMGMAYRLETANDPFFVGTFRDQAAYQNAFELKFEIRALLPYKKDTVAVGSFNRHKDFFGRTLNIQQPGGSPAHTGCFGSGFERLAFAFMAQHGPDPAGWPEAMRSVATRPLVARPLF